MDLAKMLGGRGDKQAQAMADALPGKKYSWRGSSKVPESMWRSITLPEGEVLDPREGIEGESKAGGGVRSKIPGEAVPVPKGGGIPGNLGKTLTAGDSGGPHVCPACGQVVPPEVVAGGLAAR